MFICRFFIFPLASCMRKHNVSCVTFLLFIINLCFMFGDVVLVRCDATENCLVTDVSQQKRILKRRYYMQHNCYPPPCPFLFHLLSPFILKSLLIHLYLFVQFISCISFLWFAVWMMHADITWWKKQRMLISLAFWWELLV